MSKLNTKEFAAAIKKPIGTVRGHISRGKLERDDDGYIDTDSEKNRRYIHEQTKGKGLYNVTPPPAEEPNKNTEASAQKQIKFHDTRTPEQRQRDKTMDDIELRKKKAELTKSESDAELKQLEIQKKAGKLLPVELVEKIFTINIQHIFRNFEEEANNEASIFVDVLGGTREHLAEITEKLRESLSKAISKAEEDAGAEIKQAILEYKETRSRGERK